MIRSCKSFIKKLQEKIFYFHSIFMKNEIIEEGFFRDNMSIKKKIKGIFNTKTRV